VDLVQDAVLLCLDSKSDEVVDVVLVVADSAEDSRWLEVEELLDTFVPFLLPILLNSARFSFVSRTRLG
jgi:hypothetical protein